MPELYFIMLSEKYDDMLPKPALYSDYRKITIPVLLILFTSFFFQGVVAAQISHSRIDSFFSGDIKITIDRPEDLLPAKKTIICFYALPNGNSTEQTMGKQLQAGDDWHYDIQHIRAQTTFLRNTLKTKNLVVIYMENKYKSWPAWKQQHKDYITVLPLLIDSIASSQVVKKKEIYLNGHSGGGSLIFGCIKGWRAIPRWIKRISFLDSNYGYDSTYFPIISQWLRTVKGASLNVFAYNDSVALYNGKRVVSDTGGTWYRSHLLLKHLQQEMDFVFSRTDSLDIYKSKNGHVQFFFKHNYDRGIYHTQQVELNGFIHSILCGTKEDSRMYQYYGRRAYAGLIGDNN